MQTVEVEELADVVNASLTQYASTLTDTVKDAVKSASQTVKSEIEQRAPVLTGRYKKSFVITKTKETKDGLTEVVHSPTDYQLTHLLEKGHAKRGGGRVKARVHIAPAEKAGIEKLKTEVEKGITS
jgi:hypothetical protein